MHYFIKDVRQIFSVLNEKIQQALLSLRTARRTYIERFKLFFFGAALFEFRRQGFS